MRHLLCIKLAVIDVDPIAPLAAGCGPVGVTKAPVHWVTERFRLPALGGVAAVSNAVACGRTREFHTGMRGSIGAGVKRDFGLRTALRHGAACSHGKPPRNRRALKGLAERLKSGSGRLHGDACKTAGWGVGRDHNKYLCLKKLICNA